MMKITILSILTALLPSVICAQQPHGPELQFNPRRWHTLNPICPVVFGAQANAAPLFTLTTDGSSAPVRTVSLQFGSRDGRAVDSATVTIRGVTQSHLYLKTGSDSEEKQERTFHIESRAGSNGFTQSDLSVSGITSLRTAEVTEIRFTDGTSWHPTGVAGCFAYFNGIHLVNASAAK
ncbi:hypothetical protein FTW19_23225 [Terriglobus albidus]|uniref:Uncharacterized protein n=1 Tax=Terriglobus albidus TaxID=1592106 RepID=A0A5B9EGE0_9BACT|nr:hypothetical protein [Terriglobus albidus]QEE30644.1 hypothetical protein FTW19_23225 [Terriglobus albidus]